MPAAAQQLDPRCAAADRALVERLKPMLERSDLGSSTRFYGMLHELVTARVYCHRRAPERALDYYARAERAMAQSEARSPAAPDGPTAAAPPRR